MKIRFKTLAQLLKEGWTIDDGRIKHLCCPHEMRVSWQWRLADIESFLGKEVTIRSGHEKMIGLKRTLFAIKENAGYSFCGEMFNTGKMKVSYGKY